MKKYQLKQVCQGVVEYVPVVFEEQHFCISLCTVHTALLDFQFEDPVSRTAGEGILKDAAKSSLESAQEFELIYNSFLQEMIKSYDNVKSKFSTYVAKCLSEKQRRDCGMSLAAPAIILPYEQSLQRDDEEESKDDQPSTNGDQVRMGGRMGSQIKQLQEDAVFASKNLVKIN